jgi:hypothetical protein
MPIEYLVEKLDGVEEDIRGAYVERDGKFHFDPDKYHQIRAEPLLKKNRELLDEKKKLADEKKTLDEKTRSSATDIEKQLGERDLRIAELEKENREHAVWTPVRSLAAKHGVIGDRLEAVITLLRHDQRFDLEDGKLVFKDRNGYATTIKPERAFEVYLREELPWAFEASKAGGGGANNSGKGGGSLRSLTRESYEAMTPVQREAFMTDVAKGNARLIE